MKIEVRSHDGVSIVEVHGKITINDGTREFHRKIRELVAEGRKTSSFISVMCTMSTAQVSGRWWPLLPPSPMREASFGSATSMTG